ncbi:MAG: hypothetical protein ABI237_03940 [Ginsengibacter sp.]
MSHIQHGGLSFYKTKKSKKYLLGGVTIVVDYPMEKTILIIPEIETDANTNIQQNAGY